MSESNQDKGRRRMLTESVDDIHAMLLVQKAELDEMRLWVRETVAPAYTTQRILEATNSRDPGDSPGKALADCASRFNTLSGMLKSLDGMMGVITKDMIQSAKDHSEGEGT